MANNRDQWGSSLGFILAAAGSAVGLGNLWKFPYIAWENDGGAFVIIYLICITLVGMPIMLAEILIGRRTQASPVPAFEMLGKSHAGGEKWKIVGWLGVLAGMGILSYYSVIAGWSISSFFQCMSWSIKGYEAPEPDAFSLFLANGFNQIGLSLIFSIMTACIVMRGISNGIERATKVLMPILLMILLYLFFNSFLLEGVGQALSFLFTPDFSRVTGHTVLEALGHAFFTLSLGMGAMITYGSYMSKKESIVKAGTAIVVLDTAIAMLACVIMYSIIFSVPELLKTMHGGEGGSTVGMLFVTLPRMFYTEMKYGSLLGPLFYILVCFAALSSTLSLLEVVVSLIVDKMRVSRAKATMLAATGIYSLSVLCALSLGQAPAFGRFSPFGNSREGFLGYLNSAILKNKIGFFDIFDHLSSNWLLPLGGLFISIFVGWFLNQEIIKKELEMEDHHGQTKPIYRVYRFLIRYLAPLTILIIIYNVNKTS